MSYCYIPAGYSTVVHYAQRPSRSQEYPVTISVSPLFISICHFCLPHSLSFLSLSFLSLFSASRTGTPLALFFFRNSLPEP